MKAIRMVSAAPFEPEIRASPLISAPEQVAEGVDAREAWARCGRPHGEAGIQNIRKRGHRLRTSTPAAPPVAAAVDAAAADRGKQQGPGKGKPAKGYRLKPTQLKVEQEKQQLAREQWEQVYAEATTGWAARIAAGKVGRGHQTAADFAAGFEVPADCKPITGPMLKHAVSEGRAGQAPKKRGPSSGIPDALVNAVARFAQLKQVAGGPRVRRPQRNRGEDARVLRLPRAQGQGRE